MYAAAYTRPSQFRSGQTETKKLVTGFNQRILGSVTGEGVSRKGAGSEWRSSEFHWWDRRIDKRRHLTPEPPSSMHKAQSTKHKALYSLEKY